MNRFLKYYLGEYFNLVIHDFTVVTENKLNYIIETKTEYVKDLLKNSYALINEENKTIAYLTEETYNQMMSNFFKTHKNIITKKYEIDFRKNKMSEILLDDLIMIQKKIDSYVEELNEKYETEHSVKILIGDTKKFKAEIEMNVSKSKFYTLEYDYNSFKDRVYATIMWQEEHIVDFIENYLDGVFDTDGFEELENVEIPKKINFQFVLNPKMEYTVVYDKKENKKRKLIFFTNIIGFDIFPLNWNDNN